MYELADDETPDATDTIVTGKDGKVKTAGLDEGTYFFDEIKAPDGYSINEKGVTVTITEDEANSASANISKTGKLTDTRLSALPSTGGIGTTIFTAGGCLIMIGAAVLFFVSRKKSSK